MRQLVARFLNQGLSRREFIRDLTALGFTASAAASILEPLEAIAAPAVPSSGETLITGTGGELLIAQARAAGVEYLFTNPGSLEAGFFDAVVDDPQINLIESLHEGLVISMASRLSSTFMPRWARRKWPANSSMPAAMDLPW